LSELTIDSILGIRLVTGLVEPKEDELDMVVNYEAMWKVLAELITELRKAGEALPPSIMNDLRSAKTTIQILRVDKDNPDHVSRIEEFLGNVELYVMHVAQKKFGTEAADGWLRRLGQARAENHKKVREETKFIPGIPRDTHWIRIKTTNDMPLDRIVGAVEEEGLGYRTPGDGFVIVYGEKRKVQNLVKKIARLQQSVNEDADLIL